jgi:hypothetical protein
MVSLPMGATPGTEHSARVRRAAALLAVAALAGVALGWSAVFAAPDIALQLETVGGGLTPRQAQIERAVAQARLAEPEAPEALVLSSDVEDAAFARYLLYPLRAREVAVRQRAAVRAALDRLPTGALVLVSRHGDVERLEDLELLARGARPKLGVLVREGDEVVVLRALR